MNCVELLLLLSHLEPKLVFPMQVEAARSGLLRRQFAGLGCRQLPWLWEVYGMLRCNLNWLLRSAFA